MNFEELKTKLGELATERDKHISNLKSVHDKQRDVIILQYAKEHTKYKKGDVIADKINTIRVDKVQYAHTYDSLIVNISYHGVILDKKGNPNKRGICGIVYQDNVENNLKEKV